MKRFITILASIALVMCSLSSCRTVVYDTEYDDDYHYGYDDGYDDGYSKGIAKAQKFLAFAVDDDLSSLAWDIEDEYGMLPEDALQILSNYADVPDEVDKEEINDAIWAIRSYYYDSQEVINGIEDYWID